MKFDEINNISETALTNIGLVELQGTQNEEIFIKSKAWLTLFFEKPEMMLFEIEDHCDKVLFADWI